MITHSLILLEVWQHHLCSLAMFTRVCLFFLFPCACAYPSVEETCIELTRAIEAGDMQSASAFAATLARQHATLKIQPSARDYEDTEIRWVPHHHY